jgi:hypothetical protein
MSNSEVDIQISIDKKRNDLSYYEMKLDLARDDVNYLSDKVDQLHIDIYKLEKELHNGS